MEIIIKIIKKDGTSETHTYEFGKEEEWQTFMN